MNTEAEKSPSALPSIIVYANAAIAVLITRFFPPLWKKTVGEEGAEETVESATIL